ncbi:MAG: hypothetical protein KGY68_09315, partial [Candidatus Thermoplasmatota archaeon]|nr:hypothetical protein [Candidatus Thermoplasmatota archaeon]
MNRKILVVTICVFLLLSGILVRAGGEAINGRKSVGENRDSVDDFNGTINIVDNPYSDIDWDTINSYKSAFHVHTTESDGLSTVEERIDEHKECGFDVLSITDHDTRQIPNPTWPWSDFNTTLEEDWVEEYNDMEQSAFYSELGENGMLAIKGNEISGSAHIGSYYNDAGWDSTILSRVIYSLRNRLPLPHQQTIPHRKIFPAEDKALQYIDENDGLSQYLHPSVYDRSSEFYIDFFDEYDSALGHEIFSSDDGEKLRYGEVRDLWDDLLSEYAPDGRQIYGWANTDVHESGSEEVNGAFQLVLAENHSEPGQIRKSIEKGRMFWVANLATYETNERIGVEVDEIKTETEDALIEVNVTGNL